MIPGDQLGMHTCQIQNARTPRSSLQFAQFQDVYGRPFICASQNPRMGKLALGFELFEMAPMSNLAFCSISSSMRTASFRDCYVAQRCIQSWRPVRHERGNEIQSAHA
jgi:hypothetical protein